MPVYRSVEYGPGCCSFVSWPSALTPRVLNNEDDFYTAGIYVQSAVDEETFADIAASLSDECTRRILVQTSIEPMSADRLSDVCELSRATVYRRLNRLLALGLVTDHQEIAADGNHFKTYTASLDELTVTLSDGQLEVKLTRTSEDAADRLNRLYEELRR